MKTLNMHVIKQQDKFVVTGAVVSSIRALTGNYFVVMETDTGNVSGFATHEAMLEAGIIAETSLAAE